MKKISEHSNRRESIKLKVGLYKGDMNSNKKTILEYFDSIKPEFFTTVRVKDMVTDTIVEKLCNSRYSNDKYCWDEADIYHFREYNMPLKQEFIDYVLSK